MFLRNDPNARFPYRWRWFALAGVFAALGIIWITCFLLGGRWMLAHVLLPIVEKVHPGMDAPDNWAVALQYALYVGLAFACSGLACVMAGLLPSLRKRSK